MDLFFWSVISDIKDVANKEGSTLMIKKETAKGQKELVRQKIPFQLFELSCPTLWF